MFILYEGTNCHALPYIQHKTVRVKNKRTGKVRTVEKIDTTQSPQEVHWLRPGWNQFPSHIWKQNEKNPSIVSMVKKGTIKLMAEKVVAKVRTESGKVKTVERVIGADDKPVKLQDFDERTAITVVAKTFNRDILQEWLDEEMRHRVKRAIDKQIKPLLNTTKKDDEDDDGFTTID